MRNWKIWLTLASVGAALSLQGVAQGEDIVAKAKAFVKDAASRADQWTGPTTGPKAQAGKTIVYVSSDQRNGGAQGVGNGVAEAAKAIGWNFRLIDGQGSVQGRGNALSQAIALKPNGIVLGGFDATEQAALVEQANQQGITVIGWHAAAKPGPIESPKLFTNITTPAQDTARAAAYLAIAQSDGKAGVVIFTDSAFQIALAKSDAMAEIIKQCKTCTLLETRVQSLASATKDMPQVTTALLQKYGAKWTYSLGINDLYFDGMVPALSAAGIKPSGQLYNISAGDGSESAYQRVRQNEYQYATIPEPLNLQGWQIVDEFNRAFAGQKSSGFNIPVHIVVPTNVQFDGGAKNLFDPDNGYREQYKKIWGK
ncbi:MAG: substrate-binding domain-containing protein [Thermaceae bacterium]|nr:substrate-binding domain-containing protein [Thermaceae bacterium]